MRIWNTLLSALIALSLSGCTALPAVLGGIGNITQPTAISDKVVMTGTDALARAADAYAGVAIIATAAVNSGVGTPDQLRMLRTLNSQALKLLNGADTALTTAQRAASVMLIVGQIHSILGK